MEKVRVGVIGLGHLGSLHAKMFGEIPEAKLAAVYDTDAAKLKEIASRENAAPCATLDDLLKSVEAVSIATPTSAHYAVAAEALKRGLHVFIEKPITTTTDEARTLIDAARAKNLVIQVGHIERFNPALLALEKYHLRPMFIESHRLAQFNPRGTDVAVVLDLMIHDIDLVRTFVGGGVADVSAVGVPVLTPFPDIANARITFETGAVANITASRVSRDRMRKLRIFQQSGYLSLDLAAGTGEFYRLRRDVDLVALVRDAQGAQALESFVERVALTAPEGEPLRLELENFLEAIRGRAEIAVSGDDGREALAVALTIVKEIERTLPALARGMPALSRA